MPVMKLITNLVSRVSTVLRQAIIFNSLSRAEWPAFNQVIKMKLSVEVSLYPLKDEYIPVIKNFIDRVNTYAGLKVITSTMSTQIFGDYDLVMDEMPETCRQAKRRDCCRNHPCRR